MTDSSPARESALLQPGANLAWYAGRARFALSLGLAVVSGLLLSAAFPPLELAWLGWLALIPVVLAPPPRGWPRRLLVGYALGFAHYVTSLAWLNTIGFGAGFLLALYCAAFPALWYLGCESFADALAADRPVARPDGRLHPPRPAGLLSFQGWRLVLFALFVPLLWTALEWVRAWLLTGFPWNQLGVSQWQRLGLLRLTRFTGIYGVSFLLVSVSLAVAWSAVAFWRQFRGGGRRPFPWPSLVTVVLLLPAATFALLPRPLPAPRHLLRVAAAQGNIPQCREYSPEQLTDSLRVYDLLSRAAAVTRPDLIVWPETAIPAPLLYDREYADMFGALVRDTRTPFLIGTLHLVPAPDAGPDIPPRSFNSVFLCDADARVVEIYNKMHRVPFGEYVPFERYLPWLPGLIGMGRGLTPGSEYTLFRLPGEVAAGVNICFEDAFPEISREFVRRGAVLLLTLTNDAWYAESSGSRQHMVHAVIRAVENRRPLLRSGNNSDTCLILPDGSIRDPLVDSVTGNRFVRGCRTYEVPVWNAADLGLTFYTCCGDVFAESATALAAVGIVFAATRALARKRRLWAKVTSAPGEG